MQLSPTTEGGIGLTLTQAHDAMSDIYVVYDVEWRFVYHNEANKGAMRIAGLDADAAIGKNVWEYMPFLVGTVAHPRITPCDERPHHNIVGRILPS